jgi:leucyl/phenylalanyl-tRNA--protein transferase
MTIPWLQPDDPLPPIERAMRRPNGLLAAGGGLSVARLLDAYRRGCFPWFNPGEPVLWWSPDPRMVLVPGDLHISRSLGRTIRRGGFEIHADRAFRAVMEGCAGPRDADGGTWITSEMIEAYVRLHRAGHAHSVETYVDDVLAGGLYGVAIGHVFFGESMFARATDASKLAFVALVAQLRRWGYGLIDCQQQTAHLASLGARPIPRSDFLARLARLTAAPSPPAPWAFDSDLLDDAVVPPRNGR